MLRKIDGTTVKVPIDRLSAESRARAKELYQAARTTPLDTEQPATEMKLEEAQEEAATSDDGRTEFKKFLLSGASAENLPLLRKAAEKGHFASQTMLAQSISITMDNVEEHDSNVEADSSVCGSSRTTSDGRTVFPSGRLNFMPRIRPVRPATLMIAPLALLPSIVGSTISFAVQPICVRLP